MDPTRKVKIIEQLKDQMSTFSPQMRTAAKYIIDHQADFGLDPIRDTARKASVSTYTFVNISKKLELSGYEELRQPFRHALIASHFGRGQTDWLESKMDQSSTGKIYADAASNALSIVTHSLERQQISEMESVIDLLLSANTVYLTAVRSTYSLAYYLHYVGRMALPSLQLIPRHMNSAIDDLNDAQEGDVLIAITITPYSTETIKACQYAKEKGVKLILISDSEVVSSNFSPEHTLAASVQSSHHFGCLSGMMALIETLVALLMHWGGSDAKKRIKSYERLRVENNAYWVAQKKH